MFMWPSPNPQAGTSRIAWQPKSLRPQSRSPKALEVLAAFQSKASSIENETNPVWVQLIDARR